MRVSQNKTRLDLLKAVEELYELFTIWKSDRFDSVEESNEWLQREVDRIQKQLECYRDHKENPSRQKDHIDLLKMSGDILGIDTPERKD